MNLNSLCRMPRQIVVELFQQGKIPLRLYLLWQYWVRR